MTLNEIRNHIYKKYKPHQTVNMRQRNDKGEIIRRFKATIVRLYPWHVDCIVKGHHESFTYWDMMMLTRIGGK